MVFKHSGGNYYVTLTEIKNPPARLLSKQQQEFLREVKKKRGSPSQLWLKQFSAHGDPLPIYNQLFPFWKHLWKKTAGSLIEIGYEQELGHGDWHKLFEAGAERYEIFEDNWSSREAMYRGQKIRIKDTYRKVIRRVA